MAELADAQDSGSCDRKIVGVQLPPRAPYDDLVARLVERRDPLVALSHETLDLKLGVSLASLVGAILLLWTVDLFETGGLVRPGRDRGVDGRVAVVAVYPL